MIHFYAIECRIRPDVAELNPDLAANQREWQLEFDNGGDLFSFTNRAQADTKAMKLEGTRPLHEHRAMEYVRKHDTGRG